MESEDPADADHEISQKHQQYGIEGYLEIFKPCAVARENSRNSNRDRQIPEAGSDSDKELLNQSGSPEPRHKPKRNAQPSLDGKTIEHGICEGCPHASVGQRRDIRKKTRGVKFDRGNEPKNGRYDQPDCRANEHDQ